VAAVIVSEFGSLWRLFPAIAGFARRVYVRILEWIGREPSIGESDQITDLRVTLLAWFIPGDNELAEFAVSLWRRWREDRTSVDASLVPLLISVGVTHDGAFAEALKMSRADPQIEVRRAAARAIGKAPGNGIEEALALVKTAQSQEVIWILSGAAGNAEKPKRMWEFVLENWEWIEREFGATVFAIPTIVRDGTHRMLTEQEAAGLERFLEDHQSDIAERPIRQAIERIRNDAAMIARDGPAIAEFLAKLERTD
jgi:aminopeptidase N